MNERIIEERINPKSKPDMAVDVIVPATFIALSTTISGAAAAYWVNGDWRAALVIGLFCGSLGYIATFHGRIREYDQRMYTIFRSILEDDTAPAAADRPVIFVTTSPGQSRRLPDEPRPGALRSLAAAIARGGSFAEREAAPHGYGRSAYEELREYCLTNGWLVWRDPDEKRQGLDVTRPGLAVFRALATHPTPPAAASVGADPHARSLHTNGAANNA